MAKEKTVDLFSFEKKAKSNNPKKGNSKNKKPKTENKAESKSTKDKKFNFDEEIIIGLKKIEPVDKQENKKTSKQPKQTKQNKPKGGQAKKQNNLTPKQQLAKKKRQAILRVIKWLTLLLIIIGGIIFALLSPIFNVKTISVVGNEKISTDEIISLSGLQLEENIFKCRKDIITNGIKENAYIDTVKVIRKLPDTIEIAVEERKASFVIQFANVYAVINNQGYVLEISNNNSAGLTEITGIKTAEENLRVASRLNEIDLRKLGDVLRIMEAANSNDLTSLITKINIADEDNYVLTLQKNKKTVYLGDASNLGTKMSWILMFNEKEANKEGEIILNMNLNDEKNKPYFREKI